MVLAAGRYGHSGAGARTVAYSSGSHRIVKEGLISEASV